MAEFPESPAACSSGTGCPHMSVIPETGDLHVIGRIASDGERAGRPGTVGHGEEAVTVPAAVWRPWLAAHLAGERAAADLAADAGVRP